MAQVQSTKCYIDEYENEQGQRSARLREKLTGRKVDLGMSSLEERRHFLQFLSAAAANKAQMPGVFDKDTDGDCVLVSGDLDFDAPDEIRFLHNTNLSYLFA